MTCTVLLFDTLDSSIGGVYRRIRCMNACVGILFISATHDEQKKL